MVPSSQLVAKARGSIAAGSKGVAVSAQDIILRLVDQSFA